MGQDTSAQEQRLKALIREANEAAKNLRDAVHDSEERTTQLVDDNIRKYITGRVNEHLEAMTRDINKGIEQYKDAIQRRFKRIEAALLGKPSDPSRISAEDIIEMDRLRTKFGRAARRHNLPQHPFGGE